MAFTTESNDNRSISSIESRRSNFEDELEDEDPPPTKVNLEPMYSQDASPQEASEEPPTLGATPMPNVVPGSIPKEKGQNKKKKPSTKETKLDSTEATEDPIPNTPSPPKKRQPKHKGEIRFMDPDIVTITGTIDTTEDDNLLTHSSLKRQNETRRKR